MRIVLVEAHVAGLINSTKVTVMIYFKHSVMLNNYNLLCADFWMYITPSDPK